MDGVFTDRREAGRALGDALRRLDLPDPLVLALPRGGVPVAFEVARALNAPLDLLIVRKIGAPGHEEYGIGAVVDGGDPQVVLNDDAVALVRPPEGYIEAEARRQFAEIERRRAAYLGDNPPLVIAGHTAIVVDDGVATGATIRAALQALRKSGAARVVLAVPVGPADVVEQLRSLADAVVCLATPTNFRAVGLHYVDFEQTSDEEVVDLLEAARAPAGGAG